MTTDKVKVAPRHRVIVDGSDPLTKPILDYLEAEYDIAPQDVRRVELDSPIGQLQVIRLELMVRVGNEGGLTSDG